MATRSVQTGDDVEYALAFLAKQAGIKADDLFLNEVGKVFKAKLQEADEKRFALVAEIMSGGGEDKGKAIATLRDLLG